MPKKDGTGKGSKGCGKGNKGSGKGTGNCNNESSKKNVKSK